MRQELLDPDAFPNYLIHDRREIAKLIRTLADKRVLLNAYVNGGPFSFVTAVLGVTDDPESIILDASADEAMIERATAAEELICATRIDGIKLQFSVSTPTRFVHDGCTALRTMPPRVLLRLQRRESYRLAVPISRPVSCMVTVTGADEQKTSVSVRVLDISNSGLAVVVPPEGIDFAAGMEFDECTLSIPEAGTANVKLRVRNVFHANNPSGRRSLRAGCAFIDLPPRFSAQIQRYIFRIERERRALGAEP